MTVTIASLVSEGLGQTSHLVDLGDGAALVIEPARTPARQRRHARAGGLAQSMWNSDRSMAGHRRPGN